MSRTCKKQLFWLLMTTFALIPQRSNGQASAGIPSSIPPPVTVPAPERDRITINYFNVIDSANDRLRAAGEYQEAIANAYETTMRANLIREAVYAEELQNRIRLLATNHALREMRFQEKERALDRSLEHDTRHIERKFERLEEIPRDVANFQGSRSLNEMLEAIIHDGAEAALMKTEAIPLNDRVRGDLRLLQGSGEAETPVELDNEGDAFSWNPPLALQSEELMPLLLELKRDRQRLVDAAIAGRQCTLEEMEAATKSLDKVSERIIALKPESITSNKDKAYVAFKDGRKFVTEQSRQLGFFATGQTIRAPFKGNSVQSLVAYMASNGYRFAPPKPGGENSYKAVFNSLHEIFKKIREG